MSDVMKKVLLDMLTLKRQRESREAIDAFLDPRGR